MMSTGAAVSSTLMSEPGCQPQRASAGSINSQRVGASLRKSPPAWCAGWLLLMPSFGGDQHPQTRVLLWFGRASSDWTRYTRMVISTKQAARATCPFAARPQSNCRISTVYRPDQSLRSSDATNEPAGSGRFEEPGYCAV